MTLDPNVSPPRASLAFVEFDPMPCGCVASVYRARPDLVELELLEAKGPHCLFGSHQAGHIVRLGMPRELEIE
jgi:hypothetical protein